MKNKGNKIEKKFNSLIELGMNGMEGIDFMGFSSEKSFAYGIGDALFQLNTGYYYSNINNQIEIIGNINSHSLTNEDAEQPNSEVKIIVDSRDINKPTLFINKNTYQKFNKNSNVEEDLKIIIYWEIGYYSYLVYVLRNPINDEILIDSTFTSNEYQKDINRAHCLRLLDSSTREEFTSLFSKIPEDINAK